MSAVYNLAVAHIARAIYHAKGAALLIVPGRGEPLAMLKKHVNVVLPWDVEAYIIRCGGIDCHKLFRVLAF